MLENFRGIKKELYGEEVLVTNTKRNSLAYHLSHIVRDYARVTYCVDPTYKIKESPIGIRKIEEGKVYLIKGDFENKRKEVLSLIAKELKGKPNIIIEVKNE